MGGRLEGQNFIIFPEGTRSRGEEIGEFKNASLRIAVRHGIPIVPVSIDGSYKIMEANNGKWIRPGHVILTIHPQIETSGLNKEEKNSIGKEIRQYVIDARETGRRLQEEKNQKEETE